MISLVFVNPSEPFWKQKDSECKQTVAFIPCDVLFLKRELTRNYGWKMIMPSPWRRQEVICLKCCHVIVEANEGAMNRAFLSTWINNEEFTEHEQYLSHGKSPPWIFPAISKLMTSEIRKLSRSGFISSSHAIFTRIKLKCAHMRGIYCDTV